MERTMSQPVAGLFYCESVVLYMIEQILEKLYIFLIDFHELYVIVAIEQLNAAVIAAIMVLTIRREEAIL